MGITVVLSIFGQIGDLLNRPLSVTLMSKIQVNILPGHGGILDRFDSLIICMALITFFSPLV